MKRLFGWIISLGSVVIIGSAIPAQERTAGTGSFSSPSAAATQAAVPRLAFGGKWRTVTSSNGHFDIFLSPEGNGMIGQQEAPLRVTGQFINTDGAHDYDGSLQGIIQPYSRVLTYSYGQKNGAAGSGMFTLSQDGNCIAGSGLQGRNRFTWNGTRAP